MRKRFSLVLVISIIISTSAKAGSWQDCGNDANGNPANCQYKIEGGTLTIKKGDDAENIGSIGYWWSAEQQDYISPWGKQNFENVVIENGIEDLGSYGFVNVQSVNPINVPTSVSTIGFASFQALIAPEVILPDSVTKIGSVAFYDSYIDKINIPNSVTEIESGFRGSHFTDIIVPDTVEYIGNRGFSYCDDLKSITIGENTQFGEIFSGNTDDEYVTDIKNLKIYCTGDTAKCDANLAAAGYENLKSVAATVKTMNGKTYVYVNGSRVAFSGRHVAKRIYTIEEANAVAGERNTVRIKYR